jgi:hypothetical protein
VLFNLKGHVRPVEQFTPHRKAISVHAQSVEIFIFSVSTHAAISAFAENSASSLWG